MSNLPSFEEMRRNAYRLLGDAQDELYSDWHPDAAPTKAQREAATKALRAITKAKAFLNEAAPSHVPVTEVVPPYTEQEEERG